ncbi:MAG: right-handed parallel beta-helix repeat-containing protein [Anaerolineaceae bacterium]|nr:right-handed parallel beta-helix repeat-containing protein [Anaerolineaceae bacterium]
MNKTHISCIMLLILLVSLANTSPAKAQGQTYYVSTSGSDSSDGSNAHPWLTIQHGADKLKPGDTLLINPGIYKESGIIVSNGGTAAAAVTIKANGSGVIIDNSGSGMHQDGLLITYANYVVVDGLTFQNSKRAGMRIDNSDHVTVRNSTFANNETWGLFTDFSNYTTVEDSESYGAKLQHGIYISNSSDYPTISHNRLHDNADCGLHMNGDISMGGDGIISYGLVEGNIIYNNGVSGGSGINMDGVTDTIVRNNLLYNNHASGISAYQIDGGSGSQRDKIYNNSILMPSDGRWDINIPEPDTSLPNPGNTYNKVYNNILYNAHPYRGVITVGPSDLAGFNSDYNVVMSRFSTDDGDSILSLTTWQSMGYDRHSLIATPYQLFINAGKNDYHLSPGSPAVDAGTTLSDVPNDLEGALRPSGLAYDIGAYEYFTPLLNLPDKVYLPGIFIP